MREFFKPWRRKIGVVTLVLACAFAGLWMRSEFLRDGFSLWREGRIDWITSNMSRIIWTRELEPDANIPTEFQYYFGKELLDIRKTLLREGRIVPYWSIVLPLTLLSAWLLLSKSRPRAPKTTEPSPATGKSDA